MKWLCSCVLAAALTALAAGYVLVQYDRLMARCGGLFDEHAYD